ncbi:MAG: MltA-interacting MipA family protein [Verrucomicrobia bacterium]|nr:MltA-interacting MipA family protein [Verrucomicrobiota bacterium]
MATRLAVFAAVAGMLVFSGISSEAAEATVGADFMSAYVWRGLTFNDGFVIQPSIDVTHESGLALNTWANYDVDDYGGAVENNDFQEIDLTVSYPLPLDSEVVDASVGVVNYSFPGAPVASTAEAYLSLAFNLIESVSLGLDVYYDFDEVDDYYASASIGVSLPISEDLAIDLGASAGYIGEDASVAGESGFNEYTLSASIAVPVNEDVEVSATINYVDNIDSDVLPDEAMDTDVYGGIGVYYSF